MLRCLERLLAMNPIRLLAYLALHTSASSHPVVCVVRSAQITTPPVSLLQLLGIQGKASTTPPVHQSINHVRIHIVPPVVRPLGTVFPHLRPLAALLSHRQSIRRIRHVNVYAVVLSVSTSASVTTVDFPTFKLRLWPINSKFPPSLGSTSPLLSSSLLSSLPKESFSANSPSQLSSLFLPLGLMFYCVRRGERW
ncbi:hypothetical protein IWZ00DRAFT_138544 [Phyllosticta capitalensis]